MNLKREKSARQTDRQTEITKFIKIRGDSRGVGAAGGGSNLCDCQEADKCLRETM